MVLCLNPTTLHIAVPGVVGNEYTCHVLWIILPHYLRHIRRSTLLGEPARAVGSAVGARNRLISLPSENLPTNFPPLQWKRIYITILFWYLPSQLYKEIEICSKITKVIRFDRDESCMIGYGKACCCDEAWCVLIMN